MPHILILTAFAALGVAAFALDTDALVLFVILFLTACAMIAPSDGFDERSLRPCLNRRRAPGFDADAPSRHIGPNLRAGDAT